MDFLALSMRAAWTISFILGCCTSGLVIYLTIFRTPKKYQNNIFFMRTHAVSEFCAGLFGWIAMPRVLAAPHDVSLLSYGPCAVIGPRFCYYSTVTFLQFLAFSAAIVPLNIIVRYYILINGTPKTSSLALITAILSVPFITLLIILTFYYADAESKTYLIGMGKIDAVTFSSYPVYGFTNVNTVQFQMFLNILLSSSIVSSLLALFFRLLILRRLNLSGGVNLSVNTIVLQKRIVRMLTAQAILPIFGFLPSAQYFFLKANITTSPFIQSNVLYVDSFFPIASPLVTLMMVLEYKRIILRRIGREVNPGTSAIPSAQRCFVIKQV